MNSWHRYPMSLPMLSKYPPVKPAALNYGPLKAVCLKDPLSTIWWSVVKIISAVQHDDLLFLDHRYMLEQLPHQCPQLKQNNLAPGSSCRHNSFFARDSSEQCVLHFCLLCNQPLGTRRIPAGSTPTYVHDPIEDALPRPCSLFDEQAHVILHRGIYEADRKGLSSDIPVSRPRGACIPISSDLSCLCCSLKPPSRDFERSASLEASSFCRNRQTFIVPRQSRGFT